MKLMVLDGNSLVNRAFFGIKLLTTKDGRYTNAIYGFQNILLNLLAAHKPDAVAIAWDERAPTFRHTAYDGYKATRHGMPEELAQQMPVLKELLTDLGFVQVSKAGWEADDILGTLAAACEAAGGTTLLATGDRDSLQLVDDATTVLLATNKETIPMDPAAIREKYGIERVIKLASNENPLGTSPLVQHTLETHVGLAFRYPQAGNPRLVKAIAAHHGVSPSRIIVGDGSDEVIDLLFRICVEPGVNNAVAFMPCFGIYTTQAALCGVELRQTPVNADFSFPWDNLLKLVDDKTSLVFVTTPDNPSGYTPPVAELETLAKALPDTCLLVLDEAYMDFTDDEADYSLAKRLDEFPNVIISRTFSKSFGMAGLRLGYAIVPEELADHYWRVRLPFSVNLMAEEAGIAALQDVAFHDETVRVVREGRAWLTGELTKLGCRVFPSQSNFLMFELPADGPNAASLFEDLLRRGIILRPLTSYGLPRNLRVSVGTAEENTMLINAMRELL